MVLRYSTARKHLLLLLLCLLGGGGHLVVAGGRHGRAPRRPLGPPPIQPNDTVEVRSGNVDVSAVLVVSPLLSLSYSWARRCSYRLVAEVAVGVHSLLTCGSLVLGTLWGTVASSARDACAVGGSATRRHECALAGTP